MEVEWIGSIAGCLTTLAYVPQVIRTWRTGSSDDLSYGMLTLFTLGVALWIVYALGIGSPSILGANVITLVLALTLIYLKLRAAFTRSRDGSWEMAQRPHPTAPSGAPGRDSHSDESSHRSC
jgi:MtN3 and saliva related transmembrane protein